MPNQTFQKQAPFIAAPVGPGPMRKIALGEDIEDTGMVDLLRQEPNSLEDRVEFLEAKLGHLILAVDSLAIAFKQLRDATNVKQDKAINEEIAKTKSDAQIPVGTELVGQSNGLTYWCIVKEDGFWVGNTNYQSLSAAAQGVSGVRRSGWTFWKLPNGQTVKEVYKG